METGARHRYRPTARPQDDAVSSPTYPPTSQPSSKQPSQRPTAEPVPQPTPGVPQRLPVCDDDVTWTKADKGCEWVGAFAEKRCVVKGDDGRWAFEGCRETCDACVDKACPAGGDSTTWTHASGAEFKDCQWVADFSGNRCAQPGVDGTFFSPRGYFIDESPGWIFRGRVAATPWLRRGYSVRWVAATPRPRRGYSRGRDADIPRGRREHARSKGEVN